MKTLNVANAKSAGLNVASAVGGFSLGHKASDFIPTTFKKYGPLAIFAAGVALTAVADTDPLKYAGIGVATAGAIEVVNTFTGTVAEANAAGGIKATIAKFVPQLGSVDAFDYNPYMSVSSVRELPAYTENHRLGNVDATWSQPAFNPATALA